MADWGDYPDGSTAAFLALNVHLAPQDGGPFLHAEQPEGARAGQLFGFDASTVVFDLEHQVRSIGLEQHTDFRGLAVPGNIGEDLLKNAEQSGGLIGTGNDALTFQVAFAADVSPLLELAYLPFDGGDEPEVIQN